MQCQLNLISLSSLVLGAERKVLERRLHRERMESWEAGQRSCGMCGKPLSGRQTLTCSNACRAKYRIPIVDDRLWSRVKEDSKGCWVWTWRTDDCGYGDIHWGRESKAHRIAWMLVYGEITGGLHVLHHCDNPPCCNPNHLFLGTPKDNARDKESKGRGNQAKGEAAHLSKLKENEVLEIRAQYGTIDPNRLCKMYGIARNTLDHVIARRTWKHI